MRFRKHRVVVTLALTAALALTGCDGDTPKNDATPGETKTSAKASPSESPSASSTAVSKTAEGAIARYETYLHAVGDSDLKTMCEIAAPAMATVSGDCESNFKLMLSMFSADQLKALASATIDESGVGEMANNRVDIPTSAVKSDAHFTAEDLGDVTLEYQKDNWFIID